MFWRAVKRQQNTSARSSRPLFLAWFPRHSFNCVDQMFVTTLFRREHSNMSRVEDTKSRSHHVFVCLLLTSEPQPTMPHNVGFAAPPSHNQRSTKEFGLQEENRFTRTHKSPSTRHRMILKMLFDHLFISHDACPVSRSPNAHVWMSDHTVHRREIRTERLHLSSQMSDRRLHGTVALQKHDQVSFLCVCFCLTFASRSVNSRFARSSSVCTITVLKHRRCKKDGRTCITYR